MRERYWKKQLALGAVTAPTDILVRVEAPDPEAEPGNSRSHYEVLRSPEELLHRRAGAEAEGATLHEVMRTLADPYPLPLRLYFDIDLPKKTWGDLEPTRVLGTALSALTGAVEAWAARYSLVPGPPLVANSSDLTEKVSVHAVYPGLMFRSHESMKEVVREIRGALPPWIGRSMDDVYKKNQCLRILGCRKSGTERRKVPMGPGELPAGGEGAGAWPEGELARLGMSTMHNYPWSGHPDSKLLDALAPPPEFAALCELEAGGLLGAIEAQERAHGDVPVGGAYVRGEVVSTGQARRIRLTRVHPSACLVCCRVHEKENAYVVERSGVYTLYCHRSERKRGVVVYRDPQQPEKEAAAEIRAGAARPAPEPPKYAPLALGVPSFCPETYVDAARPFAPPKGPSALGEARFSLGAGVIYDDEDQPARQNAFGSPRWGAALCTD